ncbi:MAG: ABC transporter permease [Flavobacterium sp.]|jgi:ABC-type transport system involved in multi-copper enzyme maturation permease subunit
MIRLLKIEFQKVWKNRASKFLSITYLILLLFIAFFALVKYDVGLVKLDFAEIGIFNFPFIWHFNTYVASILKFFLAIVIVSMMANEYSYGTLKQNLIDGMSKKEMILSKFAMIVAFALASVVLIFVLSLILGFRYSSYTEISIIFTDIDYLLAYFVKLIGFFSFCFFLSVLIKKSAFAIGFLLFWNIIEAIFYGIMSYFNYEMAVKIYRFFPLESMSELILNPARRIGAIKNIEEQLTQQANLTDYSVNYFQILIVLTWTFLFIYGAYKILKKRDL